MDSGDTPINIFLDLSKAFDTINHKILLAKLKYYGICGTSLNWFNSYLSNRQQFVEIDNIRSGFSPVLLGIPQGSILGPLMFIIYVNDMHNSSDFFQFVQYADDTSLFNPMSPFQDSDTLNYELKKVYKWLCINKLSLNIRKTKYIIFHNKNKKIEHIVPSIKLENATVEKIDNINFLGIHIDGTLDWNSHIDKIYNKISRYLGILSKLKHYLPLFILKTLYNSLILPNFMYGILAWGAQVHRLFPLQKKVVRILSNNKYNAHTDPILKTMGFLKISDLFKMCVLKFYFQYCLDQLPRYLQQFNFRTRSEVHSYNTRSANMIYQNPTKVKCAEYSLRNITCKIINETSPNIIDKIFTHSLQGFVTYIKQDYLSKYEVICSIENCYVCGR